MHGTASYNAQTHETISEVDTVRSGGETTSETTDNIQFPDGSYDIKSSNSYGSFNETSYNASTGEYQTINEMPDGSYSKLESWPDGSYTSVDSSPSGYYVENSYDAQALERDMHMVGADGTTSWSRDTADLSNPGWTYYQNFYYGHGEYTFGTTNPDGSWASIDNVSNGINGADYVSETHNADSSWTKTEFIAELVHQFSSPQVIGGSAYEMDRGFSNETITEGHNADGSWAKLDSRYSMDGYSYSYVASSWPYPFVTGDLTNDLVLRNGEIEASHDRRLNRESETVVVASDAENANVYKYVDTGTKFTWDAYDAHTSYDQANWTREYSYAWDTSPDGNQVTETYDSASGVHAVGHVDKATGIYDAKTEYDNGNWVDVRGNLLDETMTYESYDSQTGTHSTATIDTRTGDYNSSTETADGSWVHVVESTTGTSSVDSYSYTSGIATHSSFPGGDSEWISNSGSSGVFSSLGAINDGNGYWSSGHELFKGFIDNPDGPDSSFEFSELIPNSLVENLSHLAMIDGHSLSHQPGLSMS